MKKLVWISAIGATAFFLLTSGKKKAFGPIIPNQKARGCDPQGCGNFGASRSGHTHQGIDIITLPGQSIQSPISGVVTRFPNPYANDLRYTGIEIKNDQYTVKIFYVAALVGIGETIFQGEEIAIAQNLKTKYPGITNHAHLEVRETESGKLIDPTKL